MTSTRSAEHTPSDQGALERATWEIGRSLVSASDGAAEVYRLGRAEEALMRVALGDPAFRARLFALIDVFPATGRGDAAQHLREYLADGSTPTPLRWLLRSTALPGASGFAHSVTRHSVERVAKHFIIGSDVEEACRAAEKLWNEGRATTVDILGEKTLSSSEADLYASRVEKLVSELGAAASTWSACSVLESDDLGQLPRASVSVKPTALSAHFSPMSARVGVEEVTTRLRPALEKACETNTLVWLDMEHYDVKEATLDLLEQLSDDRTFDTAHLGVVIQAYLRESETDLRRIIELSRSRVAAGLAPLWIRLVKGAYWDTETIQAVAEGWPLPIFSEKSATDASYERLSEILHDNHGSVRAAFGSHNIRSLAHTIAYARSKGIPDNGYEVQLLHGMAEPVHDAVRSLGLRVRVYAPMGDLVAGMGYLVRRLLENTANEGFVRLAYAESTDVDVLLRSPSQTEEHDQDLSHADHSYRHEPPTELRHSSTRQVFHHAIVAAQHRITDAPVTLPVLIGDRQIPPKLSRSDADSVIVSTNPAHPTQVVAVSASASIEQAHEAVETAERALAHWAGAAVTDRANVLLRAAAWLRSKKHEIAALEVLEAGKPWMEADADVGEAIDFCEFYAREALRLGAGIGLESPPGERNKLHYRAKGVAAVISPWNFPLAIPAGMVTAALVMGNTVVLKPAEQTPGLAKVLFDALRAGGLPSGVLNVVPGYGESVGAALISDPRVALVAFTGSKAVGLEILSAAARVSPGQRNVRRVIAEMGGKNPIVVDSDADLDQVIPGVIYSAFGFSGQKCSACSRLIVLDSVADLVVERLVGAVHDLQIGDPAEASTQVGPLIDQVSRDRVQGVIDSAAEHGEIVVKRLSDMGEGWYVGPCVLDRVDPSSTLAKEEIFGPVLSVLRVADFEEAITLANDTDFALTAGVYSRSPSHVRLATDTLRAGNIYVNRHTTGAIPGRHPFGGFGMSGVGSKAGGPDYLLQFADPVAVSENTVRRGFAAEA